MSSALLSVRDARLVALDVVVVEEEWVGLFDRIELHRSVLGEAGPYEEVTGPLYTPATLPAGALGPPLAPAPARSYALVGADIVFLVNRLHEVPITFSGSDPLTNAQAAAQITLQGGGYLSAYVDVKGQVVVTTVQQGATALLEVVGGSAGPTLGFSLSAPFAAATGKDPRPLLQTGKLRYAFVDPYGEASYFYKTRFVNGQTGQQSAFSAAYPASARPSLDPSQFVLGFARLIDQLGRPLGRRRLTLYTSVFGQSVGDASLVGEPTVLTTDADGYAEVQLMRGTTLALSIEGAPLMRRITVPADAGVDRFNLLGNEYSQDDAFAVQRQELPFANRRSP